MCQPSSMKDNFNNKPLEEFFLNHLDPLEDEPRDGFWEELEPLIPPPPKKRRRLLFWWWGLGAFFLLLIGGYFWNKSNRINRLSERLAQQQLQIDALLEEEKVASQSAEEAEGKAQADLEENEQAEGNSTEELVTATNTNTNTRQPSINKTTRSAVTEKSIEVGTSSALAMAPILQVDTLAEQEEQQHEVEEVAKVVREEAPLEERSTAFLFDQLETLLTPVVAMPYQRRIRTFDSLDLVPRLPQLFDVGIFYEQSFLARLRIPIDFLSTDNFTYRGNEIGLGIGLQLSEKWRLQSGFAWSKMILNTTTTSRVTFREEGTYRDEEGRFFNTYEYEITTAFGTTNYRADIGIQFDDLPDINPVEGTRIDFRFLERDELNYLHLPLHLTYEVGENKWTWNAGLGLDYYYLLKANAYSKEAEQTSNEGAIILRDINASNESRLVGLKNSLWGARASLGLNYQASKKWQLKLDGAYQYGLSEVTDFSSGSTENLKINLDLLQFRLGAYYKF